MTNEEAIKGLKNVSTMFTGYKPNEEMFEMAIKALETVSCMKEKCAYCPHCENCDVDDETFEIKALEQKPCEDAISRQAVLEQTYNWSKDEFLRITNPFDYLRKRINSLSSVTPKEKTRWIPVSERLPEDYGEYICTMSNDNVQECGFIPSGEKGLIPGWSTCEADGFKKLDYRDIKAWMPLPEPYKEADNEC